MDSTDLSVLKSCIQWIENGHQVGVATVVETWGSAPRPVGAWLAIREDGQRAHRRIADGHGFARRWTS